MTSPRAPGLTVGLLLLAHVALAGQTPPHPSAGVPKPRPLLGDSADGSRARPVHRIPLRDAEGEVIRTTDRPLLPFSATETCGADCHDVPTISKGWHFNVTAVGSARTRPGEPWILVDADTATQLPLSYHSWPGTFQPDQVGITPWAFARMFGGRTPGGLNGEREPGPDLKTRWVVSGPLEPDCLACHDQSPAYDHAEYGRQIALENFRWAVAAASGMAVVTGAAREMPDSFDYLMPFVEDALQPRMPTVAYSADRFLPGAKVVFDITRGVPARRCYFCHSVADGEHAGRRRWTGETDIHLSRGLTCVDCHRNGLTHAMTRGYDGDPSTNRAEAAAVTCRGCHLGNEPDSVYARGRLGAPYPKHAGLPPLHLARLSCTACHSGQYPRPIVQRVKTSLAHRLGGLNVDQSGEALPHLVSPVFATGADGVTGPNRLLWPAFWGRLTNGTVHPVAPDRVKALMKKAHLRLERASDSGWPALDEPTVARVLELLQADAPSDGTAVYIAGGRLYRRDGSGRVTGVEHAAAAPYMWRLAHDVRPARVALGARGCEDCHAGTGAPIFDGRVFVDSPVMSARGQSWPMSRFQKDLDRARAADLARTFRYRPLLKGSVTASAVMLLLFVLAYLMPGLGRLSAASDGARWLRLIVNVVGVASCAASVASGFPALLTGRALTGTWLLVHVGTAPAFAASAVLVTLFWTHRNRFGAADWNRVRRPFAAAAPIGAVTWVVLVRKMAFWIALATVISAVATATAAMFPVLASSYQPALFLAHRWSVVVLMMSGLVFIVTAGLGRESAAGPQVESRRPQVG